MAGLATAQDIDPFAPLEPRPFDPDRDSPRMVRVQVEYIEVSHRDYTELMALPRQNSDATPLRVKLAQMVEEDRAEVVDTLMVTAHSGQKATCESIQEMIYPTEYEMSSHIEYVPPPAWIREMNNLARLRVPPTSTAFETRNCGSTIEVEPMISIDDQTIGLRLVPELVIPAGYVVHSEFTAIAGHQHQEKLPVFVTQRVNTSVNCRDGEYVLLSVLTPSDAAGMLDRTRKRMVFVKCDVLVVKE